MSMNLLILGANSEIAHAIAKQFAHFDRANLHLASRELELLNKKARDIEIRYQVKAKTYFFDATDFDSHNDFYHGLISKPDGVVIAFGYLADQQEAQQDFRKSKRIIETNFVGAASILEIIAADFEQRGFGFVVGVSSVAGERGRQSNYIYGAAKGALSVYLSGLRNRLHRRNVQVITVLPGFIRTKMTENLDLPEILMADPEEVAGDVYLAYKKGKDIVYTKWHWKWIMMCIKLLPEKIFKRLEL